jgi:hypothetical protein
MLSNRCKTGVVGFRTAAQLTAVRRSRIGPWPFPHHENKHAAAAAKVAIYEGPSLWRVVLADVCRGRGAAALPAVPAADPGGCKC